MTIAQSVNSATRRIPAWLLYVLLPMPGLWLFWQAVQNRLGPDPLDVLENGLGEYALQLLIAGLLVTPIRNITKINLIRFRRAIGLMAFAYVVAHFTVYLLLDQQLYWDEIWKDFTKRPYVIFGMSAFLVLIPLAITSNNLSVRKLGPLIWRRLHWGVYFAAIAGATHYTLMKKTWQFEPLVYLAIMVVLVGYRLIKFRKRIVA
ncbi:MAG: protein-methionine-sulfoxide reductase heme-binding subunit MsrQ [Rhodobacteraceae bacterium]|nr:protein-methionine-sulfoxide reductase heme-binding subunit MsrQ [Paracoccaceae bacterium]